MAGCQETTGSGPPRAGQSSTNGNDKKDTGKTAEQPSKSGSVNNPTASPSSNQQRSPITPGNEQQTAVNVRAVPRLSVEEVRDWVDLSQWVFAGLLVVVGALQVILLFGTLTATRISADAARSAANTARLALEVSERADVLMEGAVLSQPVGPMSEVYLRYKNFGRTRAENVRVKTTLEIPSTPLREKIFGPIILGANAGQSVGYSPLALLADEPTVSGILSGTLSMGFMIEGSYDDVFGNSHTFKASGKYHPIKGVFINDTNQQDGQ